MLSATAQQLPDSPVSPTRELLFHSILQAKLAQSPTGVIQARGERGRPVSLIKITIADKPSDQTSQKSLKRRSQAIEMFTGIISGAGDGRDSAVAQNADVIRQNKAGFLAAANCAGLKVYRRFCPEDMATISTEIPLSTIAVLKQMFHSTFGCDPFTPLAAVREKRQEM